MLGFTRSLSNDFHPLLVLDSSMEVYPENGYSCWL